MTLTDSRIEAALVGLDHSVSSGPDGIARIAVERDLLHECLQRLRDRAGFSAVTFITAIDHLPREPRYEVSHQLLSIDDAHVPTCTDLWPGASFSERECFDMFGIEFDGHPDLRRLLMPQDYTHHPLRKDFPHQGIEPDRLYREWDEARRAASVDL